MLGLSNNCICHYMLFPSNVTDDIISSLFHFMIFIL